MTASEKITEAEFEELTPWQPYIDDDLMYEIESDCQNHSHGVNRRILIATMTMDSEKLFEVCEKKPDAFFDGFRYSASTLGMYKRLVRLFDVGHNCLMLGLCGVYFNQPDAPFSKQEFFDAIHEVKGEEDSNEETKH